MTLTFSNDVSYARFRAIADKVQANPKLLAIPLTNIERWLAQGNPAPHRLEQWRKLILEARNSQEGMTALLDLLRNNDEDARHLKSYSPFPGVLDMRERDQLSCAYSH